MSPDTIITLFDAAAARRPDAEAVVFPGSRATFAQLRAAGISRARALHAAGIGHGDFVGLLVTPDAINVELLLGIWRLGAIPVPVNSRYKANELKYVVDHSGMGLLICDTASGAVIEQAGLDCRVVVLDRDEEFTAAASAVAESQVEEIGAAVAADDDAVLLYTSGTTANPKGALHTHASLVAEGRNVAERLGLTEADRFWSPLPMFHCGGFCTMMGSWANASTFCHVGVFDATVALDQLEREHCTYAFPAFETIWLGVLDHPRYGSADLSALRVVVNVGVPERLRQMQERMPGVTQVSSYGGTESCGFMCIGDTADPLDVRVSTSGRPLPGMELRIVDPDSGADVGDGVTGEALYRGATRFSRYHRDPEHTSRVIDEDGWFHSGDLLKRDSAGRVTFMGRLKDMLKVGGENVAAAEIEGFLLTHPAVALVQVVGVPDARYIEVPCAFVQLAPGVNVTETELIDYCLGQIATFKVPRYVRFVTEWPMSDTKIQKFRLSERIAQELREAGITEAPKLSSQRAEPAAAAG
jgi:fatty-acyl-CoA synthase